METIQKLKSDRLVAITTVGTAVECYMSTRGGAKINKMLSLTASAAITGAEALSGEANIRGSVTYKAMYTDDDNNLRTMDYISDFSVKAAADSITPSCKLFCDAQILDNEVSSRSDSEIKVTSAVSITVKGICGCEYDVVTAAPDLITSACSCPVTTLTGIGEGSVVISEQTEAGADVNTILLIQPSLNIRDCSVQKDRVTVGGECVAAITYEGPDGIYTRTVNAPFAEELFVDGAAAGNTAAAEGYIRSVRINLSGEKSDTVIEAQFTLDLRCPVYAVDNVEVLSDAFAADRDISLKREEIPCCTYMGSRCFEERLSADIFIDNGGITRAICTSLGSAGLSFVKAGDGFITAEGALEVNVVYQTAEGYESASADIPFTLDFRCDDVNAGDTLSARLAIGEITAVAKNNSAIDIMCLIKLSVDVYRNGSCSALTEITVGDKTSVVGHPITVYKTRQGDTMWDVAKALRAAPEDILAQNPDVSLPVAAGQLLTYYRQLEA